MLFQSESIIPQPQNQSKTRENIPWTLLSVIASVVVAIAAYMYCNYGDWFSEKPVFATLDQFNQNLDTLKSQFSNQNPYLWNTVGKLGADHLRDVKEKSAMRPLVFFLVSPAENKRVLGCMAKKIAEVFSPNKKRHQTVIDGNEISRVAQSKMKLNDYLERTLNTTAVAIVTDIGSLTYEIASIFFKFCDTEGTRYPNAVFIFTMDMDSSFLSKPIKGIRQATWDHLKYVVLKDGSPAQRDALIARIVDPAPIPVSNEDETVVKTC